MNQFIEWLLIGGIVVVTFGTLFYYAQSDLVIDFESQHDKSEMNKKKSSEHLKLIEVYSWNGLIKIDVMNRGISDIKIKKLWVDGVEDGSFTPDSIPLNSQVITISSSLNGNVVKLLTTNNKLFIFEK